MCPVMFGASFDDVTGQALGINCSRDMSIIVKRYKLCATKWVTLAVRSKSNSVLHFKRKHIKLCALKKGTWFHAFKIAKLKLKILFGGSQEGILPRKTFFNTLCLTRFLKCLFNHSIPGLFFSNLHGHVIY